MLIKFGGQCVNVNVSVLVYVCVVLCDSAWVKREQQSSRQNVIERASKNTFQGTYDTCSSSLA